MQKGRAIMGFVSVLTILILAPIILPVVVLVCVVWAATGDGE